MCSRTILTILTILILCQTSVAQDNCKKLDDLISLIDSYHIAPKPLDSTAHNAIVKLFLDQLDSRSLYFTQANHGSIITKTANGDLCDLMDRALTVTNRQLDKMDEWLELLNTPSDWTSSEQLHFNSNDTLVLAPDESTLAFRWQQWGQLQIINRLFDEVDSLDQDLSFYQQTLKDREVALRNAVFEHEACRMNKVKDKLKENENYLLELFLQSVSAYYDPHTQYLNSNSTNEMENALSESKYSLGLTLHINSAGKLIVSGIQPGGPAWFSGQIHENDEIKEINTEETTLNNFGCRNLSDVYNAIESTITISVNLEVKKPDGTLKNIQLNTAKIDNLDNVISTYNLKGNSNIGYLHLPSFYSDFNFYSPAGAADDLSKELLFLMRKGIDGLVIDLRNNGGGSLTEAIALIGLFVDYGTVGILETKEGLISIKDVHRGAIYDGPLLIMTNGLSASASELFASALQDYNRAIVLGSRSFGKATAQGIVELSQTEDVKITNGKYYRLNGTSIQASGVTPDILLPSMLSGIFNGESDYPYHFKPKVVSKKVYARKLEPLPLSALRKQSKVRTDTTTFYRLTSDFTNFVRPIFAKKAHETDLSKIYSFNQSWRNILVKMKDSKPLDLPYEIQSDLENHDIQIEHLKTDAYILEAYYVLTDYLKNLN